MSITAGADPDELDRLADQFTAAAARITSIQAALTPQINASPWAGRNADRFRSAWSAEHRRTFVAAAAFLADGARDLGDNADQQRRASHSPGGEPGGVLVCTVPSTDQGADGAASDEDLEAIARVLESLGLPAEAIGAVLDVLGSTKLVAAYFRGIADNDAFAAFIRGSRTFLDVGSMLVNLVSDLSQHAGEMPLDELLYHAVVETTLRFAADKGIDAGMDWAAKVVTPMVVGIVIPGVGAPIGAALSPAVGFLLKETLGEVAKFGLDKLDDATDVFDTAADAGLASYRAVKEGVGMIADGVEYVGELGADVIDGAQNLADDIGDGIDGAIDRGGELVSNGWKALTRWPR